MLRRRGDRADRELRQDAFQTSREKKAQHSGEPRRWVDLWAAVAPAADGSYLAGESPDRGWVPRRTTPPQQPPEAHKLSSEQEPGFELNDCFGS